MSFSERLQEIRTGFERPFWVANLSEIFERLSYYGAFASLALYLQEKLNFSTEQTGTLTGIFGGMVWFLAIFGGAAADRLGFAPACRKTDPDRTSAAAATTITPIARRPRTVRRSVFNLCNSFRHQCDGASVAQVTPPLSGCEYPESYILSRIGNR